MQVTTQETYRGTRVTRSTEHADYVMVGGGLQGGLLVLSILESQPDARLVLVEREPYLGGNHTWCFHHDDVPGPAWAWLDPLVVKTWSAHDVLFPRHQRRMNTPYSAITSKRLHAVVQRRIDAAPNARVEFQAALHVEAHGVVLANGTELRGKLVVDARGPEQHRAQARHFQKFVGLELLVEPSTAPDVPVLMDATVQQTDGFRFIYVLPFSGDRVLVEDTYYSDSPTLDVERLSQGVLDHARSRGMKVLGVIRKERGVLPLPLSPAAEQRHGSPMRAGYAGGFFHPTTGYSFPVALRLARHIASRPADAVFDQAYEQLLSEHQRQFRYCCWLNRLLFGAFAEDQRYNVLERFYRLPASTIGRFYSLQLNNLDRLRIVCGRPPRGFSIQRLLTEGSHT